MCPVLGEGLSIGRDTLEYKHTPLPQHTYARTLNNELYVTEFLKLNHKGRNP